MRLSLHVPLLGLLATVACSGESATAPATESGGRPLPRAVFTLSNRADANEVAVFDRRADGVLTAGPVVATGGRGTDRSLGDQGALVASDDGRWLLAVNAGSNEVSVVGMTANGLAPVHRGPSGGSQPVSIAVRGTHVYVLNAGGAGGIAGFELSTTGTLQPRPEASLPLATDGGLPAQIGVTPDGSHLVVSQRDADAFTVYTLDEAGSPSNPQRQPARGQEPFGFGWTSSGILVVSEAFDGATGASAVSTYRVSAAGMLESVTASLRTGQTAACWLVVTPDGRFAYVTNTRSNTLSALMVAPDGTLAPLSGSAATVATAAGPIDLALTPAGELLYVLQRGAGTIGTYRVDANGGLTSVGSQGPVAANSAGLVAR